MNVVDRPIVTLFKILQINVSTVKPVLNGHLKIDKTKVLMVNGSLMKVDLL